MSATKIKLVMTDRRFMGNQIEVPQNAILLTADLPKGLTIDDVKMAIKHGSAALEAVDPKEKVALFKVPADKLPPDPEQQAAAEKKAAEEAKKQGSQGAAK